jgi:hypothetical protein
MYAPEYNPLPLSEHRIEDTRVTSQVESLSSESTEPRPKLLPSLDSVKQFEKNGLEKPERRAGQSSRG